MSVLKLYLILWGNKPFGTKPIQRWFTVSTSTYTTGNPEVQNAFHVINEPLFLGLCATLRSMPPILRCKLYITVSLTFVPSIILLTTTTTVEILPGNQPNRTETDGDRLCCCRKKVEEGPSSGGGAPDHPDEGGMEGSPLSAWRTTMTSSPC